MAAAIDVPSEVNVGDPLVVTGTGFETTQAFTIGIHSSGAGGSNLTLKGTTSGGGAFDSSDIADLTMDHEGEVTVTVDDGTNTVVGKTSVWRVG